MGNVNYPQKQKMKKRPVKNNKKYMAIKEYFKVNKYNVIAVALVVIVFGAAYVVSTEEGKKLLGIEVNPLSSLASEPKLRPVGDPITGQYIVVLNSRTVTDPVTEVNRLSNTYGGQTKKVYNGLIKGYVATLTPDQAQTISNDPKVQYVEQDGLIYESSEQVNPPSWGLDRIDQFNRPLDNKYTYNQTGAGVNVYVVDGGIRTSHIDFEGRASTAADFVDNVSCPGTGTSGTGHGTHVASIIGGNTYGVAKGVRLHSIRVTNCSGVAQNSKVIEALQWISQNKVSPAIVNMSLNGPNNSPDSNALITAVNNLVATGVSVVLAAGNGREDACQTSPGGATSAIVVAATGQSDTAYDSSLAGSNFGSCVDISAPGIDIVAAHNSTDAAVIPRTGTSQAAPHVTGVMALYMQKYPNISASSVEAAVKADASRVVSGFPSGTTDLLVHSNPSGISNTKGPRVNITTPANGYVTEGNFMSVSATGQAPGTGIIASMEWLVDGVSQYTCPGNANSVTCTRSIIVLNLTSGQHTLTAKATDNSPIPKTNSKSITFTKP